MMTEFLVFQLYAPLASWGAQAVGQERPSEDHPGRSALLGLLAAALGIRRDNEDAQQTLRDACRFGVKQIHAGLALRDFHTAQTPLANKKARHRHTRRDELREEKLGTILSFRSYYQDSLHLIGVTSRHGDYSITRLQRALQSPVFPLYLGRKSCPPALPLNPRRIEAESLKGALDGYELADDAQQLAALAKRKRIRPRYFWETGIDSGMSHDYRAPRYDQPLNRLRWQFAPRDEFVGQAGE